MYLSHKERQLIFALSAVFLSVPVQASPGAVMATAARTWDDLPATFSVPGCARCHEPVYPLYERTDRGLRKEPSGLKGWQAEELETPVGYVIILTRGRGKVQRLYELVPHGESSGSFFLPAEGESPHRLD